MPQTSHLLVQAGLCLGMDKKMETTVMGSIGAAINIGYIGIMEKKMETTVMGYVGAAIRIHSFIPC